MESPTSTSSNGGDHMRMDRDSSNHSTDDHGGGDNDDVDVEFDDAVEDLNDTELDCYPYTFTPLLLFAPAKYFDRGYSNYNSVASFFAPTLSNLGSGSPGSSSGSGSSVDHSDHSSVNMLENVLYEKKNMLYEELLDYVIKNAMLVTCCIDAHFTAFQMLPPETKPVSLLYYDPMNASVRRVSGDGCRNLAAYLLLKCHYGDSQHVQDNKDYYTGHESNPTRRMIYSLWRKINQIDDVTSLYGIKWLHAPLNLDRYLLVNGRRDYRGMSTQETGNTCYFQVYLFAVLCKVCRPTLARNGSVDLHHVDLLEHVTMRIARYLLEFFVEEKIETVQRGNGTDGGGVTTTTMTVMRPLTNSNFVLDFHRYENAPYFAKMVQYLRGLQQQQQQQPNVAVVDVPNYEHQYREVMQYYRETKCLHRYGKFTLGGTMKSSTNTKSLQPVTGTDGAVNQLARSYYYKYRPANLMFGFNAATMYGLRAFHEFNALRKNQLLRFYDKLVRARAVGGCAEALSGIKSASKYRDYYFMPQFEVGQQELIDVHHYTFLIDLCSMTEADQTLVARIHAANQILMNYIFFSTQKRSSYDKFLSTEQFAKSKKHFKFFLNAFMSPGYLSDYVGLGFNDINPKEKEINSLTQTVFYSTDLMRSQAGRQEYEFEKECINQMARSNLRKYTTRFEGGQDLSQKYKVSVKIGYGYTYSKYNTLMHFLNVVECYWKNPDLSNIQVFGKDIRVLLAISCQKIFFESAHNGYYHYGPFESISSAYRSDLDLAVASSVNNVIPGVSRQTRSGWNHLVITDRVFEYGYLQGILRGIFARAEGVQIKSDNEVINLALLSLMLDFGLYSEHAALLNIPFLKTLQHETDTRELQVEVANLIYEFDRKNSADNVTRSKVEELLFECSYKFLVNKDFPLQSNQFRLISTLNSDPDYQSYILLCKVYMSLCQINKSVEVDYYKFYLNDEFHIVIPSNFSKTTGDYLEEITRHYTFSERGGMMAYDDTPVFDLNPSQPEIHLHRIRFDSATAVQSMVKYIEISNVLPVVDSEKQYLVFIADNVLLIEVSDDSGVAIRINKIDVEVATIFFNEAVSFVPCFKYVDSEDVIFFASRNIHYMVDQGGQFSTDYYGMKHELIECIRSEEVFVDLNDEHVFKSFMLSELLTESKTVLYSPNYLLQVPCRQQLINLLGLAIYIRNVSFFILVLFYLRRASVKLEFVERERDVVKISGPWREAILYVLSRTSNASYNAIFKRQFFDLNQHEHMPLDAFIEVLCNNFTKYQRFTEDGHYQIVPTKKQKAFLRRIICAEECFHFSEVGSGKTKVILPLLCQTFLSNNAEAHRHFARGAEPKDMLVILVPEHLVNDARSQVFRYCLNLNFREEYRVYDDIFALMHNDIQLGTSRTPMKRIFVTSFNSFKKALTYDSICAKVQPHREHILVVADEVDDFLDRDKLVFNICTNKSNAFDRPTLDLYFEVSRAAYHQKNFPRVLLDPSPNPVYWTQLYDKFKAIHLEIQDASRSINKSFGIFNATTLRHCSTNIIHDIEGYKSLIARPYESVNRAMPGSYYSDVERTIYLTFVILTEDIAKYDELFQAERKFITFEYWNEHFVHQLDYDDLVYGHEKLSEIADKHPETKSGLNRFLFEIILRRMEIRDKSRSVSSVDIIFNFDCIGFTGTPFLDNYPTFNYISNQRKDDIPDLIDRSFYAYTSEALPAEEFEERFARFQGQNSNVNVDYIPSEFIRDSTDEMEILASIFTREKRKDVMATTAVATSADSFNAAGFNAIVDLCGIFKRSSIHDVRDLIFDHFGPDQFHYIYHIDQSDNSDRVLCIKSGADVQYDEEFYKHMCKTYGADLRHRIFFFVDNRNVIGKDIPFQLVYQRHFGLPLFTNSVIVAHDVDDFSKIWQAMGRSRTMNETTFSIYKSGIPDGVAGGVGAQDIKKQELTRLLYVHNCDCKMAGNISSIYLTLVALFNLSQRSFYYKDEIVNPFIDKMEMTISGKVARHEEQLVRHVLGTPVPARILLHILMDKFQKSSNAAVAGCQLTLEMVEELLGHVVKQKFELRVPSNDIYDDFICFLSGEQKMLMEISYTKQQQKQKQKQKAKNQDSDAMGTFDKRNQLLLTIETENYFKYTLKPSGDLPKIILNVPVSVPILTMSYGIGVNRHDINVYPTVQFLYSHNIHGAYITQEVQDKVLGFNFKDPSSSYARFLSETLRSARPRLAQGGVAASPSGSVNDQLRFKVQVNHMRQNPQYTIAALQQGVYVIGMKDQFNIHDMQGQHLREHIQYVVDEMGFVLFDRTANRCIDSFGPYFIEQYILMEVLSKQEVAENVLDYYQNHRETLQRGLQHYSELQGKGFICWRFLMNEATKAPLQDQNEGDSMTVDEDSTESPAKRSKGGQETMQL